MHQLTYLIRTSQILEKKSNWQIYLFGELQSLNKFSIALFFVSNRQFNRINSLWQNVSWIIWPCGVMNALMFILAYQTIQHLSTCFNYHLQEENELFHFSFKYGPSEWNTSCGVNSSWCAVININIKCNNSTV